MKSHPKDTELLKKALRALASLVVSGKYMMRYMMRYAMLYLHNEVKNSCGGPVQNSLVPRLFSLLAEGSIYQIIWGRVCCCLRQC